MPIVAKPDLAAFAEQLLLASHASADDARLVSEALVWSDLRARHPQGVLRLPNFVQRLERGLINSPARFAWQPAGSAATVLDAGNGFGHVAGHAAMQRAIELADTHGVGVAAVRHSNLYGAAAWFCSLATDRQYLGFSCTNAVAKVAPFGGTRPVFGTNPLAFGCPTRSGVPILVDLSTSAIAGSTARGLGEAGTRLPEGVALDKNGKPTTDPKDLADGTLLPAAGPKGFGLALMVEILCGAVAGAAFSKEVGSMVSTWDRPADTGHFFLAVNITAFSPLAGVLDRIERLLEWIAESDGAAVRFPGELRGATAFDYTRNGIPLPDAPAEALRALAQRLKVTAPW